MSKALMFDMDGTITDLYGVDDWNVKLDCEDPSPYYDAQPTVNPNELIPLLDQAKTQGYTVGIISWLSKDSSKDYAKTTRNAKRAWLAKYYPNVFDEIHLVKYGATKRQTIRKHQHAILVDDNAMVRKGFTGQTIDASNSQAMMDELRALIAKQFLQSQKTTIDRMTLMAYYDGVRKERGSW